MVASKWSKESKKEVEYLAKKTKPAAAKSADQVSGLDLLDETEFGNKWYQGAIDLNNFFHIVQDSQCVQFTSLGDDSYRLRDKLERRAPGKIVHGTCEMSGWSEKTL